MGLSFQEKSLWVMFVGLIGSFAFYFWTALHIRTPDLLPPHVALFTLAVVLLVLVQIAGHILVVIVDRRTQTDERDRLIQLRGSSIGSYTLAIGVMCSLCTAVVTRGNFACAHVLLASWVLAQLVEIGSQLFLYRRGF